jgi:hypothetical protein
MLNGDADEVRAAIAEDGMVDNFAHEIVELGPPTRNMPGSGGL